ncbi:MAG: hypothetical protein ABS900_12480, partial [Candidatus Limivicinus sp.]
MKKSAMRSLAVLLMLCMMFALTACGQKAAEPAPSAPAGESQSASEPEAAPAAEPEAAPAAEAKWLKLAESFAYPSLDAHKDYYGWYTSIYGVTETLFRV